MFSKMIFLGDHFLIEFLERIANMDPLLVLYFFENEKQDLNLISNPTSFQIYAVISFLI